MTKVKPPEICTHLYLTSLSPFTQSGVCYITFHSHNSLTFPHPILHTRHWLPAHQISNSDVVMWYLCLSTVCLHNSFCIGHSKQTADHRSRQWQTVTVPDTDFCYNHSIHNVASINQQYFIQMSPPCEATSLKRWGKRRLGTTTAMTFINPTKDVTICHKNFIDIIYYILLKTIGPLVWRWARKALVTQKRGERYSGHVLQLHRSLSLIAKQKTNKQQPRSLSPFSLSGLFIATSQPLADLADRGHAGTHAPHTATVTLCDCTRTTIHARMQTASHTRNNQATGESEWKYNDTGSVIVAMVWKPRKTENGRQEKDENFTVEFISESR